MATATHQTSSLDFVPSHEKCDSLPIVIEPADDEDVLDQQADTSNSSTMKGFQVPTHPIPSMQEAFAESMLESSSNNSPTFPKVNALDAASRRRILLDQDITEDTHASRWKQRPGQRFHELWKLMSQISFGIYLLLNGIAKDDEQVLNILQGHVDEVDAFLEMTLEDFDLAQKDIEERLKFLKMPLENIDIFDAMLEDRNFRLQIVSGNERIEHIITRTATAMKDSLRDVQQGLDATKEFTIYLAEEQDSTDWREERPDMEKVYDAMKGNADGWYKAYVSLQTKGNNLGVALVQLGTIVAEMDKRAGEISRKSRFSLAPGAPNSPPTSPNRSTPSSTQSVAQRESISHHTIASISSITKDLPADPNMITPAIRATLPAFQFVSDRERTPESESHPQTSTPEHEDLHEFTLQPRTYTPVPQKPPTPEPEPPAPEIRQRNSIRQRFSLRKKAVPERRPVAAPVRESIPVLQITPQNDSSQRRFLDPASSPSLRGPDSAYCSDNERKLHYSSSQEFHRAQHEFGSGNASSPRSDQQHFHPVRASPHSPLQRPWTAGPTNLRSYSASTTNLSIMSNMTTVTENGVKVKKKRGPLGWLKNAFALSEEEKAEFERRKRAPVSSSYAPERRPQPKFLDGRRIR